MTWSFGMLLMQQQDAYSIHGGNGLDFPILWAFLWINPAMTVMRAMKHRTMAMVLSVVPRSIGQFTG